MRKPASRGIISDSVELCEAEVCFLHIQLVGTNVRLPKMHRIASDVDFESWICIVVLCFPYINIACIHICGDFKESNAPSVCHKLWSIWWLLVQICSQNIECLVRRCVPNTDNFRTFWEHTFDNSPTDPSSSSSLNLWSSMHGVATLKNCFVVLFANSQKNPRISWHDLPRHKTMKISVRHQVSPWLLFLEFFHSPGRNPWFEHTSIIIHNILANLTFCLSATQINVVKKMMLVLQNQRLSWKFSKSDWCSVPFQPVLCRPQWQTRIVFVHGLQIRIPRLELFPNRACSNSSLELPFPQRSCQKVTVQISFKRNDWVFHAGWFCPLVSW